MNDYRDASVPPDHRLSQCDGGRCRREHGVTDAMLDEMAPIVAEQHERLSAEHAAGDQRWMDLPYDTALADRIARSPPRPGRAIGISS